MQSLICITTAARSSALKAIVWNYLAFCREREDYAFAVSLDGPDPATAKFCHRYGIPLIASNVREGVGLSKNRILISYPEFSDYFFIEDDAYLTNPDVFDIHRNVAKELNIHHLSLGPLERFTGQSSQFDTSFGRVIGTEFGSAQFNYFTRRGIELVGGFHPRFAEFCRFGHTEHSYRFVNAGLAPMAFMRIQKCDRGFFALYNPRSVTRVSVAKAPNRLAVPEAELIEMRMSFFPITTLAEFQAPSFPDVVGKKYQFPRIRLVYEALFKSTMILLGVARGIRSRLMRVAAKSPP